MKCLHTNDWHLWHLTPSSRLDSWPDTMFRKLDQVAEIAQLEKVNVIAVAGDLFNSVNTSYAIVARLAAWLKTVGVPVLAIPGNHDERYNRLDSLSTTPLGVLFETGALIDVSYQPYHVPTDVRLEGIALMPVQIVGIPWPDAKDPAKWAAVAKTVSTFQPAIVLAHAFASKTGGQFFGQTVLSYEALAAYPFQVYHFGHDHSAVATQRVGSKLFLNFGALGRGSLAGEELQRTIYAGITEYMGPQGEDGLTFEFKGHLVKLKVEPAEKIFDLKRYAYEKTVAAQFEAGLGQQIADDFLSLVSTQSLSERVAALDVEDDVRARVQQYLTAAEEAVA